jgi:hypothetical protein
MALEAAKKAAQAVAEVDAIPNPPDKPNGDKGGGGGKKTEGKAGGGRVNYSGTYLTGEYGPELVKLPIGATVFTNKETKQIFNSVPDVGSTLPVNMGTIPQKDNSPTVLHVDKLTLELPNVNNPLNPVQMKQAAEIAKTELAKLGPGVASTRAAKGSS